MTRQIEDYGLDAMLQSALAPPKRDSDDAFVARVKLAVAEDERFRRWRAAAIRRQAGEAMALFGIAGAAVTIVSAPGFADLAPVPMSQIGIGLAALIALAWYPLVSNRADALS